MKMAATPYEFYQAEKLLQQQLNLALQLIQKSRIESKTVIVGARERKKDDAFCTVYFIRRNFF